MNILLDSDEVQISSLFSKISQSGRIQILLILGEHEACVCHLEAVTGMRQASISQHLMTLRKTGLVTTNRVGRHIFYRLARPEIIDLLEKAAQFMAVNFDSFRSLTRLPVSSCTCPYCNPDLEPQLICK